MGSEALACEGKEGALLLRKGRLSRRQRADTARFVYSAHAAVCDADYASAQCHSRRGAILSEIVAAAKEEGVVAPAR